MHKFFQILLLILTSSNCFSQPAPSSQFVGSIPTHDYIKRAMKIPVKDSIDFFRCEMKISYNNNGDGSFNLKMTYGLSQPNTNGFINGGIKVVMSGIVAAVYKSKVRPVFKLSSKDLGQSLYLIKMDDNIYHFADEKQHFLVGNGGWGFMLNRVN